MPVVKIHCGHITTVSEVDYYEVMYKDCSGKAERIGIRYKDGDSLMLEGKCIVDFAVFRDTGNLEVTKMSSITLDENIR